MGINEVGLARSIKITARIFITDKYYDKNSIIRMGQVEVERMEGVRRKTYIRWCCIDLLNAPR